MNEDMEGQLGRYKYLFIQHHTYRCVVFTMSDYNKAFVPFVELNSDGVYDPVSGDYPDIIGDEALRSVFNDAFDFSTRTKSIPGENNQLNVYQNPLKEELYVPLPDNSKYEVSLADVLGRS